MNLKQYKSEHYVSCLAAQVSPITPMNPSVIISKRYHYLLAEINWLLIFHKLLHPTSCLHHLLLPKRHSPQMAKSRRTLSYDIPFARTNKFKARSSCTHYIIMSNLLLQFTQFIHYPLLPLVLAFYCFVYPCLHFMSILTASLLILLFAYPVATFCDCNT